MGVLNGVKVVEIAGIGPGTFYRMSIGSFAIDAMTSERIDAGEGPPRSHQILNCGKRSVVLNQKIGNAVKAALRIVEHCGALTKELLTGVMEHAWHGQEILADAGFKRSGIERHARVGKFCARTAVY